MKSVAFHVSQKIHCAFGLLLIETMSPRTFKNRPIWSHCLGVTAKTYNGGIVGRHCISPRDTTYGVFCAKRKVSNSSQCKGNRTCGSILCSNSSRGYSSAIVVKCPSKIRICKEDVQTNVHY